MKTPTYKLISCLGTRTITGTLKEAMRAVIAMENELQPSFGITVECEGETIAEIRDEEVRGEDEVRRYQISAEIDEQEISAEGDTKDGCFSDAFPPLVLEIADAGKTGEITIDGTEYTISRI